MCMERSGLLLCICWRVGSAEVQQHICVVTFVEPGGEIGGWWHPVACESSSREALQACLPVRTRHSSAAGGRKAAAMAGLRLPPTLLARNLNLSHV